MAKRNRRKLPAPTQPATDLAQEQVSIQPLTASPRDLYGPAPDPSREEIPLQTYREMMVDAEVSASVRLLAQKVAADEPIITPAKDEARQDLADEIAAFVALQIKNVDVKDLCESFITDALSEGYKIAEQTFVVIETGPHANKAGLHSLRLLDVEDVSFAVDSFWNVVGFRPRRNYTTLLPVEKFVWFAPYRKNNDPRGQVWIRSAHTAYNSKQRTRGFYDKFLDHYSIPSVHLQPSPQAKAQPKYDKNGQVVMANNKPVIVQPDEALLEVGKSFENRKVLVTPHGTTVDLLQVEAQGEAFERALKIDGQEITLAILLQTRATKEAQHGSKADSQTGENLLNDLVWSLKGKLARTLRKQCLEVLVYLNWGPENVDLTPSLSLGDSDRKDWADDASAVSELAPHVTDSQWDALTTQVGLPLPLEGEERPRRGSQAPSAEPRTNKENADDTSMDEE